MNDIFREVFDAWEIDLNNLGDYFQKKYDFEADDEDINAVKNTILGIAKDVPKLVSLALYCEDRTVPKKVEKVKAEGRTKTTEQISIVLNDKMVAETILHAIHDYSKDHNGLDIYNIETIVQSITNDPDFHIDIGYAYFTPEEAYGVYVLKQRNEYEIVFPLQIKIKED